MDGLEPIGECLFSQASNTKNEKGTAHCKCRAPYSPWLKSIPERMPSCSAVFRFGSANANELAKLYIYNLSEKWEVYTWIL
ncbi:MAG TPA: hypothetical protein VJ911_02615, partial [Cryomorphaceae bacterium]|nr:hypothetical protein [Cryomorphaceae bacterium]